MEEVSKKTKTEPVKEGLNLSKQLKKLMQPVPKEFIEEYTDDGTTFTGYKAQYAINLLNEVFGLGQWHASFRLEKVENIKGSWLSYGFIEILLVERKDQKAYVLSDGVGASYAKRIENSLKGCKTSAFKNACRYLGIGNELYLAGHDEDIPVEVVEEEVVEDTPNAIADIKVKIESTESLDDLEKLLPEINKTEGKAVKDLIIRLYNAKRLSLGDKK